MNSVHKLNLNNTPSTFKDGEANDARNIVATIDQKAIRNEDGFLLSRTYYGTIIGRIEVPTGCILFIKDVVDKIVFFTELGDKIISSYYFNFNIDHPITGRYTFNSSGDLLIVFSEGVEDSSNETRMINITTSDILLTEIDVIKLNLIPNVVYPTLSNVISNEGSLLVGTYQLCISYMIEQSVYTNFSILSEPIYVFGFNGDNKIGTIIDRCIVLTLANLDRRYKKYKIGIVYKGEDAFEKQYETDDILTSVTEYRISNVESFGSSSIDELTVGSISYIKDNACVGFEGKLLRGNVKTLDYTGLDEIMRNIAANVKVELDQFIPNITDNNIVKHFKEGEQYALYIGCIDYKGNYVNAYNIPWKNGDTTFMANANSNSNDTVHLIPFGPTTGSTKYLYKLKCTLPANVTIMLGAMNKTIASFVYFYAEHSMTNSKILGQGVSIRDIETNDFNNNQTYRFAFKSTTKARWYSFEHLFNKSVITNAEITSYKPLGYFVDGDHKWPRKYSKVFGVDRSIMPVQKLPIESISYVHADNVVDNNIAGDSFHRVTLTRANCDKLFGSNATQEPSDHDKGPGAQNDSKYLITEFNNPNHIDNLLAVFELSSKSNIFYNDLYKQKLCICSSIIDKTDLTKTKLSGDFFYGNLTIRATTPSVVFAFGTSNADSQAEDTVFRVILSINLESRYNFRGRYSGANDYQKVFNGGNLTNTEKDTFFNIPYKYDNFINTPQGKGYNISCNNNGYDNLVYDKELDVKYHFFNRIIRSNVNSSESTGVPWMIFKADSYKDVWIDRGPINILEADQQNVYIQQEFALSISSVRDTLSNNAEGSSYLGSSDLFTRQPYEILFDSTGYLGCDNRFGGCITLFGYFVIDSVRKNIYLIRGIQPKKLNTEETEEFFANHLVEGLTNPYRKQGIALLYDSDVKSVFLTQQGGGKDFTIHYNMAHDGWLSFHDYIAEAYFRTRVNNYCLSDGRVFKRNHTNKAIYFDGMPKKSYVSYIYAAEFKTYKQICGIMWDTILRDNTTIFYDKTIDSIMIYNDTQCTGIIDVNKAINWFDTKSGVYKKDSWYFNDIWDVVLNDKLPFIDKHGVLINSNINSSKDWFNLNNFISKYVFIKLVYNNQIDMNGKQLQLILNTYDVNATKSIR